MTFSTRSLAKITFAALAFIALPLQAVQAQETNVDAVTRRLIEAVRAGELHPDVAAEMVAVMARHSFHQRLERAHHGRRPQPQAQRRAPARPARPATPQRPTMRVERRAEGDEMAAKKARYNAYAKRIEEAVKQGKMSREDGRKYMEGVRKQIFRSGDGSTARAQRAAKKPQARQSDRRPSDRALDARRATPNREEMAAVWKRLGAAVEAGKLTEQQARERWEAYLKSVRSGERAKASKKDADRKKSASKKKSKKSKKSKREKEQIGDF